MPHNTRKAPTASATLFKRGTTKTGNDGNKWTIVTDTRGVQRWQKINATTTRKNRSLKQRRHKSARLLAIEADPDTVWGKNKPLEKFWQDLASGRKVVIIYADAAPSLVNVPVSKTAMKAFYDKCDADPNIVAVLSSNMSQDAYEVFLYPKARDSTVRNVIHNYKKYFKSSGPIPADMIEKGFPEQKKVLYPS